MNTDNTKQTIATVEDQAGAITSTGTRDKKEITKLPKHSMQNLLSKAQRCNSFIDHTKINKQRKILDTSAGVILIENEPYKKVKSPIAFTLIETIGMVRKYCEDLQKLIIDIPNTHKGIKETISRLGRQNEVLNRESIKKWLEENRYKKLKRLPLMWT